MLKNYAFLTEMVFLYNAFCLNNHFLAHVGGHSPCPGLYTTYGFM